MYFLGLKKYHSCSDACCFCSSLIFITKYWVEFSVLHSRSLLVVRFIYSKRSVFIPIPKKGNAKECSNYRSIAFISHTSKVMLQILQVRLQQHMNQEIPDIQARFRKSRGTRDQTTNMCWIRKKAREFQKTSTSALLAMPKPLTAWITENWKIFRDRNIKSSALSPEKSVCTSRSNS